MEVRGYGLVQYECTVQAIKIQPLTLAPLTPLPTQTIGSVTEEGVGQGYLIVMQSSTLSIVSTSDASVICEIIQSRNYSLREK